MHILVVTHRVVREAKSEKISAGKAVKPLVVSCLVRQDIAKDEGEVSRVGESQGMSAPGSPTW